MYLIIKPSEYLGSPTASSSEFTYDDEGTLAGQLILHVRKVIGPFAAPKKIIIVPDLPKTRSGKIMRRIMRKISCGDGDQLGDLSTLAEPSIVDAIKTKFAASKVAASK